MSPARLLRVVTADDEPVARATLRQLLAADAEVVLVAECTNGTEALAAIRAQRPELLFLDVHMPETDGLRVLEELPAGERPAVVLTTAFDRYALRAFEEEAVDYLLKPFSDERFRQALERAKVRVRQRELRAVGGVLARLAAGNEAEDDAHQDAHSSASGAAHADRLHVRHQGSVDVVDVARLLWVEAADQYVLLHTEEGERLMRASMGELERCLDPARFLRVHRSAIVALERIVRLESQSGGTGRLLLCDGTWTLVSRSRIPTVRRRLG